MSCIIMILQCSFTEMNLNNAGTGAPAVFSAFQILWFKKKETSVVIVEKSHAKYLK